MASTQAQSPRSPSHYVVVARRFATSYSTSFTHDNHIYSGNMSFSGSTIDDGSSPLAWLFSYKLDMDDREPVVTLYSSVGMYIPSIAFWTQVLLSVTLQSILSAILSIWTWYSIIQQPHSFSRFLVGYGVLIPLWLTFPRLQLEAFGIRNMVINFCLSGIIPTLNIFHTMEGTIRWSDGDCSLMSSSHMALLHL